VRRTVRAHHSARRRGDRADRRDRPRGTLRAV